jgi:hypothetical protein
MVQQNEIVFKNMVFSLFLNCLSESNAGFWRPRSKLPVKKSFYGHLYPCLVLIDHFLNEP